MDVIFGYGGLQRIIIICIATAICSIAYFKWRFSYWKRKKIPYLQPSIPWGTLQNFFTNRNSFGDVILHQYRQAKQKGHKFVGLFGFTTPFLMILDLSLIKQVISIDFKYFVDRGMYFNEIDDPLSAHLFNLEGLKWRNLRTKLTPTFTTGKMKSMFSILKECSDELKIAVENNYKKSEPIDIKDVLARFTTNVIMSSAFGIECNTFTDQNSDFRKYGKRIFQQSNLEVLKQGITFAHGNLCRRLGICAIPKEASAFFMKVVKDTLEYREKNQVERNDFMKLLIEIRNGVHTDQAREKHLTLEELAAQAFVFFIAGFETSSTTMAFCLFELATNTDIQEKVRDEIVQSVRLHNGKLTYDAINDMKYMGRVIEEVLRKYPPIPLLNRKCSEDYRIPDTDTIIKKGTIIFIPVIGLHNDSEYFPNPEKFDPERFSENSRHDITPYSYLPFGEGPRNCIGLRFGLMQTKVGLTALLQNYRFSLNSKTKMPLRMNPTSFVQSVLGDMWLDVEKI